MRRLLLLLAVLAGGAALLAGLAWREATADPVIRRAELSLPGWPGGAAPVTVALLSDIHVGSATTDPRRLARIVALVNAQRPDLVVLTGDLVSGHTRADAVHARELAGLSGLRAPLGVAAVLGNHDHWTRAEAVRLALRQAGVTVLRNAAVRRGPLALGGLDDWVTGHADLYTAAKAMRAAGGAPVLLSHSPDTAPEVKRGLILAGHTHCGQVLLPWWGPLVEVSRYGARYRCGLVREGARTVVITAGTGTSVAPFRLGAPPDIWLLRLGP